MTFLERRKSDFVAAGWVVRTVSGVRRQLRRGRVDEVTVPPPPASCAGSVRAAGLALRLSTRNCLVRSLVRQAWLTAAGEPRDVVIGVRRAPEFSAHAWVDGDAQEPDFVWEELMRLPSR